MAGVTRDGNFNFGAGGSPAGGNWIPLLNNFQSDGIDYLYDLETQSNNLFFVGEFVEYGTDPKNYSRPFYNACYRIKSIDIPSPTLNYDVKSPTRVPHLTEANYTQEVTIEWIEDVYHSVQKYHSDWMLRWYNRQFDCFRCGLEGKFRKCTVIAFHYINNNTGTGIIEVPEVQPIFAIKIGGLCPTGFGNLKFDYSSDANDTPISLRYYASSIGWYYNKDLTADNPDDLFKSEESSDGISKSSKVWSPTDFAQDKAQDVNASNYWEKVRATKSMTSYIVGESSIG